MGNNEIATSSAKGGLLAMTDFLIPFCPKTWFINKPLAVGLTSRESHLLGGLQATVLKQTESAQPFRIAIIADLWWCDVFGQVNLKNASV